MKQQIKSILEAKGWKIKKEKELNKLLWSLKWRYDKYWEIFISRKEFKKFWLTEKQLRWFIEKFRMLWFLKFEWQVRKDWNKYSSNIYSIWEELKKIFNMLIWGIKNMYKKVWEFIDKNWIEILKKFWVRLFNEKKNLIEKKVSIWKRWQIKNWKTWKWYNIFSYLMEFRNISCFELAKELKL